VTQMYAGMFPRKSSRVWSLTPAACFW